MMHNKENGARMNVIVYVRFHSNALMETAAQLLLQCDAHSIKIIRKKSHQHVG